MLCVVDDAHWLDPATADALLFCARRLGADRVAAWCSPPGTGSAQPFDPHGIPELALTGLDPEAARSLLLRAERLARTRPRDEVAERLIAETGGNPLALLELPAELSAGPAPRVRPAAVPAAPHRPRRAGLPRPQPAAAAARAVAAAARGRGRHRRARRGPRARRRTSAWPSRPSRPRWTPGCSSSTPRP